MAGIQLKSIGKLFSEQFCIPNYQRGYRWEKEQVEDLLNDLYEFYNEKKLGNRNEKEIYCLQPLVVQKKDALWHVIDGQQRLTTLFIMLSCLGESEPFTLEYQTRERSKQFLKNITSDQSYKENADFYYMYCSKETIKEWMFKNIDKNKRDVFLAMIKEKVCFIWYELASEDNPISVFTRLNIGKIGLTESELVKALFLNRNNFYEKTDDKKKLLNLVEVANEWDQIEYKLQDDRFWLFFHEKGYNKPTRIDFLLDLDYKICRILPKENFDSRTYPVFSFYYDAFLKCENKHDFIQEIWSRIVSTFRRIEEWFNDDELFHYVGYICATEKKDSREIVRDLLASYDRCADKSCFVDKLKGRIKELAFPKCLDSDCLNCIYEGEGKPPKTNSRNLLLLHNVQTVIDQNESIKEDKKFSLPAFTRFPFHLLKKECWDVEHIRPSSLQDFVGERKKSERAKYIYVLKKAEDEKIKEALVHYEERVNDQETSEEDAFEELWKSINEDNSELSDLQKNKIWNYVLLDASTNREYGNACFSIKREYILRKERGFRPRLKVDRETDRETYEVTEETIPEVAFVPVCTSSVFSKSYSNYPTDLKYWSERDAAFYRLDIEKCLWWYLKDYIGEDMKKEEYESLYEEYKKNIIKEKLYDKTMFQYVKERLEMEKLFVG